MWPGNQANRFDTQEDRQAVRQEERSCALNDNALIHPPHSDNVHSKLGLFHSSQPTGGLFLYLLKSRAAFLNVAGFADRTVQDGNFSVFVKLGTSAHVCALTARLVFVNLGV